jgi:hypothetical protein
MTQSPAGWGPDGMYRIAHDKAISKSYARCITHKQECDLYQKHFQEEVNRLIARGVRYEAVKAKGKEERRLAREAKFRAEEEEDMIKAAFETESNLALDAEISALIKKVEQSQEAYVDSYDEMGILMQDDLKVEH